MFFYSSVQVNPRILNWGSLHIVYLKTVFADNPYYQHIYKDESSDTMQVFQIYAGHGFYHSLTQGHKYIFSIGQGENSEVRTL